MNRCLQILAIGGALSLSMSAVAAQGKPRTTGQAASHAASAQPARVSLTASERRELTRAFVLKWGMYAQRVYGVPVGVWSQRMVADFAKADAANFRRALARDTFEGAIAELGGFGGRASDDAIITRMASVDPAQIPAQLGQQGSDLVYTPVQPCRILDTRARAAGAFPGGQVSSFRAINNASFADQGGAANDCGVNGVNAAAVAVSLTAVQPTSHGYAVVFPFGSPQPDTASTNYVPGNTVNSGIISRLPVPLAASDLSIYTTATVHFVVDIVGYFAAPVATPLDCVTTFATTNVSANDLFDLQIPACPTNYTLTGAGCRTPGFNDANWAINGLFQPSPGTVMGYCSGTNLTNGQITVEGVGRCCRTPGR